VCVVMHKPYASGCVCRLHDAAARCACGGGCYNKAEIHVARCGKMLALGHAIASDRTPVHSRCHCSPAVRRRARRCPRHARVFAGAMQFTRATPSSPLTVRGDTVSRSRLAVEASARSKMRHRMRFCSAESATKSTVPKSIAWRYAEFAAMSQVSAEGLMALARSSMLLVLPLISDAIRYARRHKHTERR